MSGEAETITALREEIAVLHAQLGSAATALQYASIIAKDVERDRDEWRRRAWKWKEAAKGHAE